MKLQKKKESKISGEIVVCSMLTIKYLVLGIWETECCNVVL